jgi:hypothetical protein
LGGAGIAPRLRSGGRLYYYPRITELGGVLQGYSRSWSRITEKSYSSPRPAARLLSGVFSRYFKYCAGAHEISYPQRFASVRAKSSID